MTDQDLQEVRALRSQLDRPRPGALDRARARAFAGDSARPDRRRRAWLVPVLAVGVAVAVTAVGVVAVVSPRSLSAPPPGPATAPPTQPSPSPSPAAPTLAQVIDELAALAEAGPAAAPIRPDQFVRSTLRFRQEGAWYTDDMWLRPQGMVIVRVRHRFPDGHTEDNNFGDFVGQQQREFDDGGASLHRPTPGWLAALNTDPARLGAVLAKDPACPPGGCDGPELDRIVWNEINDLVRQTDVVMTPQLRAALLRVLGHLSNVAPVLRTVDGHRYWGIGMFSQDGDYRDDLLVDPATGRIVGDARFVLGIRVLPSGCPAAGKRSSACQQALATPIFTPAPHPERPDSVSLWSTSVDDDTE
jgi:hypothetical protein